jgi:hypothetical protein
MSCDQGKYEALCISIDQPDPLTQLDCLCYIQKCGGYIQYDKVMYLTEYGKLAVFISTLLIFAQAFAIYYLKELRIHPMPLIMAA